MLEPTWRSAWVARLNLLWLKSNPPTRAIIAPFCGLMETSAELTSGSWDSHQLSPTLRTDLLPGLHNVVDFTRVALLRIRDKATGPTHALHRQRNRLPLANSATASGHSR
ncbi:hypothetical protein BANRA_00023 [Klebsiella pneumoniae]|nr:hypothetical protein BANRA_00023 [Klebsiella pneumoniae]